MFLALGCSGVVPVIHMLTLYGVHQGAEQGAVGWLALMGVCYIIGAVLYAMRVPERFFPGKCNLMVRTRVFINALFYVPSLGDFSFKKRTVKLMFWFY